MDSELALQIRRLISEAVARPEPTESTGEANSLAQLGLWAAKAALAAGELEEAQSLLNHAAVHVRTSEAKDEVARHFLLLARAWERRVENVDAASMAEQAVRSAAELSATVGAPALAQLFRRRNLWVESVNEWSRTIRAQPQDSDGYLHLADLYEQINEPRQALDVYLELIQAAPTSKNYLIVAERLDELAAALPKPQPTESIKIALVGNATLDHLRRYVTVECYRAGLRPEIYQAGFDQYVQEMLDPTSGLYQFEPDVLICAVHASRLFPDIHQFPFDLTQEERADAVEAGVRTLENLLDTFTARSPALVLVHNMVVPQHPALGVLDLRDELGQAELFGEINRRLAEVVRTRYRNVYVVDEDRVQSQHGKAQATDARLWLTARMGWSHPVLAGLAKEYLRYLLPLKGLSRKCVVLDLDNTLWGGVIGDDGLSGIQVGAEAPGNAFLAFQRELERLWRRGILLAICSKNNPKTALAVFDEHPDMVLKRSHFSAWRINWEPKPSNMRAIAEELNIGLSSLVFLDDSPIERLAMRTELPQVMTPELPADPAQYRQALLELGVFDGLSFTEEDRSRNQLYAEQRARTELEAEYRSAGTSLQDYLQDLDIIVEIDPINHLTLPRVAQLTSKTNQFNLTTRRYSEAQIDEAVARGWLVYSMRVVDRFGDNGLVAVALLSPQPNHTWEVDTFLMSCRVMGRGVETAFLAHLAAEARDRGGTRLQGWYLPTAANMPVQDLYREHGFMLIHEDGNGNQLWDMDLIDGGALTPPTWLTVRVGSTVEA